MLSMIMVRFALKSGPSTIHTPKRVLTPGTGLFRPLVAGFEIHSGLI
jgi:hypothetical protein